MDFGRVMGGLAALEVRGRSAGGQMGRNGGRGGTSVAAVEGTRGWGRAVLESGPVDVVDGPATGPRRGL